VVLVHGEAGEMGKLKRALEGKAAADGKKMHVYSPKNCQAVEIKHSGSKTAKVLGALAENPPAAGDRVRGLLVRKDFGHMLVAPGDLPEYTKLATAAVTQRQMIPTETPLTDLRFALEALFEGIHTVTSLRKESPEGSRGSPPASPKAKAKKAAKKASPRRGGKKEVKAEAVKDEPAELDAVKAEDDAADAGEEEPEGLSVNGGALTIVRRAASGKTGVAHALVEWSSDPLTDMIADAVLSVILQLAEEPAGLAEAEKAHKNALEAKDKDGAANARLRIVAAMLGVQFGEPDVDEPTQTLRLRVENADATVQYKTRSVECADPATRARVETALERIDVAIADSAFARTLPSVSGMSGSRGGSALLGT
jgi:cleavage and polyadenylation specificity factor subunit 3